MQVHIINGNIDIVYIIKEEEMKYWFNEDESIRLYNGDCFNVMNKFIEKGIKVDCIVTDPPYGMNFQKIFMN